MYRTQFDHNEVPADIRQYFEEVEVQCGAPWERITAEIGRIRTGGHKGDLYRGAREGGHTGGSTLTNAQPCVIQRETLGWRPTCSHGLAPVPATILDPFCGSGTTGVVAMQYGRRFIGIELSENYCALARRRMAPAAAQEVMALEEG